MITVYLLWTLLAGQPVDVDAFLVEDQCKATLVERIDMLKLAKAQHPQVPDFSFSACIPAPVQPGAVQGKV